MLDLVRAQAGQFAHVLHLAPVDIHLGLTSAQHLDGAVPLGLKRRHMRQCVGHGAGLLQDGTLDGCAQGFALDTGLGQLALDNHLAQHHRGLVHLNNQPIDRVEKLRLIADARHLQEATTVDSLDLEVPLGIGHCTLHKRRVGQREQHHVYKGHGLAFLVKHCASHIRHLSYSRHGHQCYSYCNC